MIITFCGHADFFKSEEYEQRIFTFLEETIGISKDKIRFNYLS